MSRYKARLGRCYELAGRRVMDDRAGQLIHGTIQGMGYPPNPHAWVILETGEWWEPISEIALPPEVFRRLWGAEIHQIYDYAGVLDAALAAGHWGPWPGVDADPAS